MKDKLFKMFGVVILCATLLTSCYSYTTVVGNGAQGSQEVTATNHYLIYGLAPVGLSDAKVMAGGATDYTVTTEISFINGFLAGLTCGIYTPTTTTVRK